MALSPQNRQVYDFIREKWVEATREEVVRQKLLLFMVESLQYPRGSLAVEKGLSEVVRNARVPNRRLDVLCFDMANLKPLLLIECKAVAIHRRMFTQMMGYNAYVGAPFICLVNHEGSMFLRWKDHRVVQKGIPNYLELVNACV